MLETPKNLIATWISDINQRQLESLLGLYSEEAVLIPTFSNRLLNNPVKIRTYFEDLTNRAELSIALHENTLVIHPLHDRLVSLSGIYCWRFAVDEELLSFEARFSLIADLALPRPILHHHSSQIPRTL